MGGILVTSLWSIGTSTLMTVQARSASLANNALKGLSDHTVTKIVRIAKGDHALSTCPRLWRSAFTVTSWPEKRNMRLGFQYLRKLARQIRLTSAEVMS